MSNLVIAGSPVSSSQASGRRPCRGFLSWILRVTAITIQRWNERSRQRRALGWLADLDDSLLKDIGLTREQARREASKPFWQ